MIDVDTGIMVAYKLFDIHEVVGAEAIEKGGVGGLDDKQGEGEAAGEVAGIEADVGIADGSKVPAFGYGEVEGIVVVLAGEQSFYAGGILEIKYGVFGGDGGAIVSSLVELLVGRP